MRRSTYNAPRTIITHPCTRPPPAPAPSPLRRVRRRDGPAWRGCLACNPSPARRDRPAAGCRQRTGPSRAGSGRLPSRNTSLRLGFPPARRPHTPYKRGSWFRIAYDRTTRNRAGRPGLSRLRSCYRSRRRDRCGPETGGRSHAIEPRRSNRTAGVVRRIARGSHLAFAPPQG